MLVRGVVEGWHRLVESWHRVVERWHRDGDPVTEKTSASEQTLSALAAPLAVDAFDHERAKEALSAIAAASTRKEDEASAPTEKASAKKRRTRAVSAEPEQGAAATEHTPEAPAQDEPQAQSAPEEAPAEGFKSHLEYVKERRSSQDAEDALAGALERLRARRTLPDELLRDP